MMISVETAIKKVSPFLEKLLLLYRLMTPAAVFGSVMAMFLIQRVRFRFCGSDCGVQVGAMTTERTEFSVSGFNVGTGRKSRSERRLLSVVSNRL